MLAAMATYAPFYFGIFLDTPHITNYKPGGVVVDDVAI
ncbi:unnamed protein product [Acidithrix sp. C25]|nr:unnamed protein product [Acidithrix sp. C25]